MTWTGGDGLHARPAPVQSVHGPEKAAPGYHASHRFSSARRYAQLEEWCDELSAQPLLDVAFYPRIATYAQVRTPAEQMRRTFDLGGIPAASLPPTLESTRGVKVFYEQRWREDRSGGEVGANASCRFPHHAQATELSPTWVSAAQ